MRLLLFCFLLVAVILLSVSALPTFAGATNVLTFYEQHAIEKRHSHHHHHQPHHHHHHHGPHYGHHHHRPHYPYHGHHHHHYRPHGYFPRHPFYRLVGR
uniref:Histidine-rich glycoprotein n=1 Tax=Trichuris muris TaxID=70415 RepID=A0A5S6R2H9_TRIMR